MSISLSQELERLLDPERLSQVKRIELKSKRRIDSTMIGNYRSSFRGSGLVFSDLREYQPGDDVKKIHWKASARSGRVYIKSYQEDRHLKILLALDLSRSTFYGGERTKYSKALEFAALITIMANSSQDSVGICLFSDRVEEFVPPKARRHDVKILLSKQLLPRTLTPATDLKKALEYLNQNLRSRTVIFLISDFFSEPFEEPLKGLARRHDLIAVMLEDQLEWDLPSAGIVEFEDAETGQRYQIDTQSSSLRELKLACEARKDKLSEMIRRAGGDIISIEGDPIAALSQLMRRRAARFR